MPSETMDDSQGREPAAPPVGDALLTMLREPREPEAMVRAALSEAEWRFRLVALDALADWDALGLVATQLFEAIAHLERPSWGNWNGLLHALRAARRAVLAGASADVRSRIEACGTLHETLARLDRRLDPAAVRQLDPFGRLVHIQVGGSARVARAFDVLIALRNRIGHDTPTDPAWWSEAAKHLRAVVPVIVAAGLLPTTDPGAPPRAPWHLRGDDGARLAYNGLTRTGEGVYVMAGGRSVASGPMGVEVLRAFQRLLGRPGDHTPDFRRFLARLAPEATRGVLIGDYLVGQPVGAGGFATVHVGHQVSTGRRVAVKLLQDTSDEDTRQRFKREAEFLSRIDHPKVVKVLGYGEEPWFEPTAFSLAEEPWWEDFCRSARIRPYIAMEWVDGVTLDAFVRSGKPSDLRLAARWFADAAEALAVVHGLGLIHRDLKPANLMVTADGDIKLMDFGIARELSAERSVVTRSGEAPGTIAYMSPEQVRANLDEALVGPQTDVYSLCATFYEVFTCRRLFDHDTAPVDTVRDRKLKGPAPVPPRTYRRELPWELNTILLGGLEAELRDRYPSARALERDIRHYLADEPIEYRRPSLWRRAVLGYRRNRAVANMALVVAVTIIAALVASVVLWRRSEVARREAVRRGLLAAALRERAGGSREAAAALLRAAEAEPAAGTPLDHETAPLLVEAAERPMARLFVGHRDGVTAVAFADDGRAILSASRDGIVKEWDAATGALRADYVGHHETVTALVLLPDGDGFVTASADGTVRVWSRSTRRARILVDVRGPIESLSTSADGRRIAIVTRAGDYGVYDTGDGRAVLTRATAPQLVPAGHRVASVLLDAAGAVLLMALDNGDVVSADIASRVNRWRVDAANSRLDALARSPDGQWLATSADGTVRVWRVANGGRATPDLRPGGTVKALAFTPDGRSVVVGTLSGATALFDVASGAQVQSLVRSPRAIDAVAVAGDGTTVAFGGGDHYVHLHRVGTSLSTLAMVREAKGTIFAARFLPGAQSVVYGGENAPPVVWDWQGGRIVRRLALPDAGTIALAIDGAGSRIVTGGADGIPRVWRAGDGALDRTLSELHVPIWSVAISADGQRVAVGTNDGFVRVWETTRWTLLYEHQDHGAAVWDSSFAHAGHRLVTVGTDRSVLLRDVDGGPTRTIARVTATVEAVAFSADDRMLAFGAGDNRVHIWDLVREAFVADLPGHTSAVRAVAFSPDGRLLASGSSDSDIRLWSTRSWQLVGMRQDHSGEVTGLDFSPDSSRLVSTSVDRTVRVWDTALQPLAARDAFLGSATNVRVCRATLRTVPVVPFPASDEIWAPESACGTEQESGDVTVLAGTLDPAALWGPARAGRRRESAEGVRP